MANPQNYTYDDHSSIPFKLIPLKPSKDGDKGTLPHRHNFYELFILESGGGKHFIDFSVYPAQPQHIHVVPPGSIHLLKRDTKTSGYVILFSREFYHLQLRKEEFLRTETVLNYRNHSPSVALNTTDFASVIQIAKSIENEIEAGHPFHKELISLKLNEILYLIQRHLQNPVVNNQSEDTPLVHQFLQLLNTSFADYHQVQDYAKNLFVSSDLLNLKTKNVLGKTASEVIKERLLLESKRLLMHSDSSVKEICFFIGMTDPAYFSRWIKNSTGSNPKELRESLRSWYAGE